MKREWTAGYVLCVSAGVVMILAAFLPWGSTITPPRMYTAIELRFFAPFFATLLMGAALVVVGLLRRSWAAAVAMAGAFGAGIMMLMIHGDLYGRLTAAGAHLGADLGHPYGFGVAVFLANGVLAFAAAVAISVESEPAIPRRAA